MMLTLHTGFEGYTPVKLLEKISAYRERYLAKDENGTEVCLIVYDTDRLPHCYADKTIPEFEIIPLLTNAIFPTYLASGTYSNGRVSRCWMATSYGGDTSLRTYIGSAPARCEREMLLEFYNLLVAVKEIAWRRNEGCCNAISVDNITMGKNGTSGVKWHFSGLECVSEACNGRATFDTRIPSRLFCAPETRAGHYNIRTDIFSLGIVLAFILQGEHPWTGFSKANEETAAATIVKQMREHEPRLAMAEPLKNMVSKAIAFEPSDRYQCLEDFGADIAKYLGNENLTSFACFTADSAKPGL